MMKRICVVLLFTILSLSASAQFQITGKLRTLKPMTLKIEDFNGNIVAECEIKNGEPFKTKKMTIVSDLFRLTIGERVDVVLFTNNLVTIKGYLNDQDPRTSNVIFTGMDDDIECKKVADDFNEKNDNDVSFLLRYFEENPNTNHLIPAVVAYKFNQLINVYEEWKSICDLIPDTDKSQFADYMRKSLIAKESYKIGGTAYDFNLEDINGKRFSLSDFKGKYVLIDFWASWCGPCRKEMQNIKNIFSTIKSNDIQFISISLDDNKDKWLQAMEEEKIPWLSLYDKDGFKKSILLEKYGFNTIPFIVLIDKDGKTVQRSLRGEEIKNIISKSLENN